MPKVPKKKVVFVMLNPIEQDIRLTKEIKSLKQKDYTFTLLCWDRECKTNKLERPKDYEEKRLKLKAPAGNIKALTFFPIWWCFIFIHLLISKWDIVHAVNFNCIIPALIAGKLKRKPVIYEILDVYEDMTILPGIIRSICLYIDKLFMLFVNAIIIVDELQIEEIGGIPNSKIILIYDSPPDDFTKKDFTIFFNEYKSDIFTLFNAGNLYKIKRLNLDKIFKAIEQIDNVKLIIAGYGDLVQEIKEAMQRLPGKVEFIGKISYEEVIKRGMEADLFFILRDTTVLANKYTCGSTLFNAMICGKPILANKGSSTAIKVHNENCGLVVNANNIEEIKEAIIRLRDNPGLCKELGANARRAYEERYSWEVMEQRFLALYRELTGEIEEESGKSGI